MVDLNGLQGGEHAGEEAAVLMGSLLPAETLSLAQLQMGSAPGQWSWAAVCWG